MIWFFPNFWPSVAPIKHEGTWLLPGDRMTYRKDGRVVKIVTCCERKTPKGKRAYLRTTERRAR